MGIRWPVRRAMVFFLVGPRAVWGQLLVHVMRRLVVRWRPLLLWMKRAKSLSLRRRIVS